MTDPSPYPQDKGPFDAAAATPEGEKSFTADDPAIDDPAAPDAVQYGGDRRGELAEDPPAAPAGPDDDGEPELLDAETNTDPDMSVDDGED
ncbi:hypothetical protein [Microbacterium sp. 179-I 3D3 NHS]|uniref:hypothetical protein n=1 Tax=Microbacterium sp. 179-I 3D3 NHS TaxID=3142382 RepID=UPI0039A29EEA